MAHIDGCSVLHGERDPDEVKKQLEKGVNPHSTCLSWMTTLHWSRNHQTTLLFINAGVDVNARDSEFRTPLHLVPDAQSVELLVKNGAHLNARNFDGNTPLHVAKTPDIARKMIELGADINALNGNRDTPLHKHIKSENTEMVQLLIESGARKDIKNRQDLKPFEQIQNTAEGQVAYSQEDINQISSDLVAPSLYISLIIYVLIILNKKYSKKYKGGRRNILVRGCKNILSTIGLLSNPFAFHFSYLLQSLVYELFYFIPGSLIILRISISLLFIALFHIAAFYWAFRNARKDIGLYFYKNIYYLFLIPYYIMSVAILTSQELGIGIAWAFFAFPYLLIVGGIAFLKSKRFFSKNI